MKTQLTVALRVTREQFMMEDFIGSDDIFALVKAGSFRVKGDKEEFTVKENEGMLFRKNVLYHRRVIEPVTMYLFRYKSQIHAFSCDHVIFRDGERLATTFSMLERLDAGEYGDDFAYRSHLFADLTVQHAMESRTVQSGDPVIERAMEEIRHTLHVGVEPMRIAERSGLSYVQFLRRFKQFSGMKPSDYIAMLRLQKAKALLADTDLLVKEISAACGFENEYYFSNFFKKRTSLSPTAFRGASRT